MQDTCIYDKAIQFLARREHSERELIQKLRARFPDCQDMINQNISVLKDRGYLNDLRFLESRIRHRIAQGYGQKRIADELMLVHGLQKDAVWKMLSVYTNSEEEISLLMKIMQKRTKKLDLSRSTDKQKLIQYCLSRGFELSDIRKALQQVADQT